NAGKRPKWVNAPKAPKIRRQIQWDYDLAGDCKRIPEVFRQDSHDSERLSVEVNRFLEDLRVPAKSLLPGCIGEQSNFTRAFVLLRRLKSTAQARFYAQRFEEA